jgi:hypothetical protein
MQLFAHVVCEPALGVEGGQVSGGHPTFKSFLELPCLGDRLRALKVLRYLKCTSVLVKVTTAQILSISTSLPTRGRPVKDPYQIYVFPKFTPQ